MKKPSDCNAEELRNRIIGLGEKSIRKSYYPELRQRINELEVANLHLKQEIIEHEKIVAEQKKLEEQLHFSQKLESLGTLAGGIAHDFNNILSPILGYAELAARMVPNDSQVKANLEQIIQASMRAKNLVKQILDYCRPGKGEFVKLRLGALVKEAIGLIRASLPTSINIYQKIDSEAGLILADPTKMHQIIMNLCTNSNRAMREKGGQLGITVENVDVSNADMISFGKNFPAGVYVKLEISDTGQGIDRKILGKIFDPYFTTARQGEGTGLGLSVVHSIVKSHGGFINCCSEPGCGTTFRIYFPQLASDNTLVDNMAATELTGGHERIMIVDDEQIVGELVAMILNALGYQANCYSKPTEALEQFLQAPDNIDLLITDITMPVLSGIELVRQIKKVRPKLPIIFCSGLSDMLSEKKAQGIGVKRCLMKPVPIKELANAVRSAIDERSEA